MFFDQVLAFDHVKKEIHLIVTADLTRDVAPDKPGAPSMRSHRMGGIRAALPVLTLSPKSKRPLPWRQA